MPVSVTFGIFVTLRTICFVFIAVGSPLPAPQIFGVGYNLKMIWIAASAIAA
jgi:hypothetical protein